MVCQTGQLLMHVAGHRHIVKQIIKNIEASINFLTNKTIIIVIFDTYNYLQSKLLCCEFVKQIFSGWILLQQVPATNSEKAQ